MSFNPFAVISVNSLGVERCACELGEAAPGPPCLPASPAYYGDITGVTRPMETNRSPLPGLQDKQFPTTTTPSFSLCVVFFPSICFSPSDCPSLCLFLPPSTGVIRGIGWSVLHWPYLQTVVLCTPSVALLQRSKISEPPPPPSHPLPFAE